MTPTWGMRPGLTRLAEQADRCHEAVSERG
jgi:hypothetical protein